MNPLRLDSQYVYSKTPWLSWKELFFGLENGYIDEKALSGYVCDALTSTSPPEAIELALLEPQENHLAKSLLKLLNEKYSSTESDPTKPWIFLLLSFLFENKENYDDPLGMVEQLYADFDYPEEIAPLVRYMPLPEGVEGCEELLLQNWRMALSNYKSMFHQ
ncbi:DUF2247 family protein [Pseudomonas arsenicoxydans]|uniref:DUF2247 family protein n=1 Tax=Pseudomonas arsenicoxydans TaxID=702115 RepID=A0A4P6G3N8_9PSED|nr:DUF2247 family protein [Pseudomonas arsenicoxydans]QAY85587.1 hypothetical protein CUN61_17065 [Pseudomonas arsenicoxydans]